MLDPDMKTAAPAYTGSGVYMLRLHSVLSYIIKHKQINKIYKRLPIVCFDSYFCTQDVKTAEHTTIKNVKGGKAGTFAVLHGMQESNILWRATARRLANFAPTQVKQLSITPQLFFFRVILLEIYRINLLEKLDKYFILIFQLLHQSIKQMLKHKFRCKEHKT